MQESEEELELLARRPLALDRTRVHPSVYHLAFRCVADALEDESAHFDEARQASMTEVCAVAGSGQRDKSPWGREGSYIYMVILLDDRMGHRGIHEPPNQ